MTDVTLLGDSTVLAFTMTGCGQRVGRLKGKQSSNEPGYDDTARQH